MKTLLNYTLALFLLASTTIFTACSSDDDSTPTDELAGITKFKEITNDSHTIELYSHAGSLEQGFNEISIRIKDNATGDYVKNAEVSWMPIMHMAMMNHSCPKSEVEKVTANGTLYEGYIVFQMAQNATEYWDLKIDYTINGTTYSATSVLDVPASAKRRVNTFTGTDGAKYIVAYAEPHHPKVAINDVTFGVWKMQDMMNFPVVDGYTLKIDPRMPSMGNHSSPNNVDATQKANGGLYEGKLSLTMTGYWKINLQLLNAEATVLKGEAITDTVLESSIFFELEF
ncbi:FixH family protein [Flavobacterium buctense]|uniref:FixH family protein n=1 Tax=Flavobacterium buctense TaxID=1648146 RepID=A0ABU9DXP4_9FLAO|nr:FixH family protein [Flavobacterium buctense]